MRKYYKCDKVEHLAKDYRTEQKIKNRSIQEDSDDKNKDKQEGFVRGWSRHGITNICIQ